MKGAKYGVITVVAAVLLTVGALAYVIHANAPLFQKTFSSITAWHLALVLLASACAYTCMGLALHEVLKALDYRIGYAESIGIAFVSTTVNYIVSSLGAGGFALRAHLLKKRNVPFPVVLISSALILMLLYFVLALLVMQGCLLLIFGAEGGREHVLQGVIGVTLLLSVCFVLAMLFFKPQLRSLWMGKGFKLVNRLFYLCSVKQIPDESYAKFYEQVEQGIALIHEKKHKLTTVLLAVCGDWIFTISVLELAFYGLGVRMGPGELVVGFAVGLAATLIPILPGGVGALEFAMTAVFAGFGVPWATALTAVLIFRVAYFIIPGLISVLVYWGLRLCEGAALSREDECSIS
ncbi:MAG TPA: lysylphosphatidylglycerol synthase transmembrane domain-containing protein [Elusimicrobiales bacterium]|nr:lysylphosphatidylglycerol synthase transmembrane domain-containing protein [Elusimicrobiales bacterium]